MIFLFFRLAVRLVVFFFIRIALIFSWTGTSYGIPALFDTLEGLSDEDCTWIQKAIVWLRVLTLFSSAKPNAAFC